MGANRSISRYWNLFIVGLYWCEIVIRRIDCKAFNPPGPLAAPNASHYSKGEFGSRKVSGKNESVFYYVGVNEIYVVS
jgi:hypothetical protein